jgi:hypothetical protein
MTMLGGVALALSGCSSGGKQSGDSKDPLAQIKADFPTAQVSQLDPDNAKLLYSTDFASDQTGYYLQLSQSCKLPAGSLVTQTGDHTAFVLHPGASPDILTQLSCLNLQNGALESLLPQATLASQGYTIYDVAGAGADLIWVEQNLESGAWAVFAAQVRSATTQYPSSGLVMTQKLDSGDVNWDPPTIAAWGSTLFWTVMPSLSGNATKQDSLLKACQLGSSPQIAYTSHGRMLGEVNINGDFVTIIPRADSTSVLYQLTALSAQTLTPTEIQVLPSGYKPSAASYTPSGFIWTVDATYANIDNLGKFGSYLENGANYFYVNKQPAGLPLLWNGSLIGKSSKNIVGYNLAKATAFVIAAPEGAASYGDCLASTQNFDNLVLYTNIVDKDYTLVRIFNHA